MDLSQWEPIIQEKARKYGVHPNLVRSVIWQESRGNPKATSGAGAQGLMQLMPGTAKDLGVKNAYDPIQNIDGGVRYLKQQIDKFGLTGGVAAYNAGPGNVQKHKGIPPFKETQDYVQKVLGKFTEGFNPQENPFQTTNVVPTQAVKLPPQKKSLLDRVDRFGDSKVLEKELFDLKNKDVNNPSKKTGTYIADSSWMGPDGLKNLEAALNKSDEIVKSRQLGEQKKLANFGASTPETPWDTRGENLASPAPRDRFGYKMKGWNDGTGAKNLEKISEFLNTPLLPQWLSGPIAEGLTKGIPPLGLYRMIAESPLTSEDSPYRAVSQGIKNSVSNTISGLTTPKSIGVGASLMTPAAPYILGAMTPGMVSDTYQVGKQGIEAIGEGDYGRAAENLTSALTSAAMTYAGAKGAYKGIKADVAPFVEPYIPAIKEVFAPGKSVDFSSNLGAPIQQLIEGVKRAKEKGLLSPKKEVPAQIQQPTTTIPESPQTLELQLNALKEGKTKAVLSTPGAPLPEIPKGFSTLETNVGTWVYNPKTTSPYQIKKGIRQGTYGELLGYVEPKSATTTQIVSAVQNGVEAKSAVASPESVGLQAAELKRQFPNAEIKTGGPDLAAEVLNQRIENLPLGAKQRGLITTIKESPNTPPQVSEAVQGRYDPITNRETLARAQEIVKADPIKAKDLIFSTKNPTAETNAIAVELMRQSNLNKDFSESIRIAEHVAKQATSHGQAIQAWAMYDKLGPEGLTKLAAQTVQKAREELPGYKQKKLLEKAEELAKQELIQNGELPAEIKNNIQESIKQPNAIVAGEPQIKKVIIEKYINRAAKELKLPHLDEAFIDSIQQRALKLQNLPEGSSARATETALILRDISELVPPSFLRKVATFQTMAQLTNPKTVVRNLVGNAIFSAAENVKDVVAAPLDRVVSVFTGQRTKSLGGGQIRAQITGFLNGLKQGTKEALQGIDLKNIADKWEVNTPSQGLPRGRTFKGKILGNIEKAMNVSLRASDRAFYQAAFDKSIAEQMYIAKVSKPTPEMLVKANFEGLYKTFQDDSVLARVFSGMKRSINLNKEFGVGDILLKYPKTPGNILARSIDYSPAGFVKSAFEFGKFVLDKGFDQKNFVESISRALVGTGLVYSGYKLAQLGLLRNTENAKEGVRNLERSVGLGQNQLNVTGLLRYLSSGFDKSAAKLRPNDQLITYDWAVPASIPISMGARGQERTKQLASKDSAPLDYLSVASAGIEGGIETMGDQPLIKAFTQLGQQRDFSKAITKSAEGIPASFTPTLFKQVAQYVDNTRRDTKGDTPIDTAKNLVLSKIPYASKTLPPQMDVFGRQKEAYQNGSNSFFNTFLNPAFNSSFNPTPEATVLYNLYKSTNRSDVLPKEIDSKEVLHGVRLQISADDRIHMQKKMGGFMTRFLTQFASNPQFNNAPDLMKSNLVSKALTTFKEQILVEYFRNLVNSKPKQERENFIQNLIEKNDLTPKQAVEIFKIIQ